MQSAGQDFQQNAQRRFLFRSAEHGPFQPAGQLLPDGLLLLFLPLHGQAITKDNADAEYLKGNYQQAIKDYEELLKSGVSADLYYNLGNAYYRTDNITRAILNYERAYELSPGDEDIRFNLQLARSKTIDKITPASEMFFVTWYHALVHLTSVDRWAFIAVLSIIVALILVLAYLFAPSVRWQKIGFYGAASLLVLFLLANLFAFEQKRQLANSRSAIITSSSVNVMKTPSDKAASDFVLHEGTKVNIVDTSIKGWRNIRVADGREGWVKDGKMEDI